MSVVFRLTRTKCPLIVYVGFSSQTRQKMETNMTNYLSHCTPKQRETLTKPSRHQVALLAFAAAVRKSEPDATMNEILERFVRSRAT